MHGGNMINQIEPWFDEKEKQALMDYMDSGGWLTEHTKTKELEKMIARFIGVKYCVMVPNGTIALTTALLINNVRGIAQNCLIPDYTMIATATAVDLAGARQEFVDVEFGTCCIDVDKVKKKFLYDVKAIMLVSINGRYPTGIEELIDLCRDESILLIEDACQSLGSYYKRKHIGRYGAIGCFSLSMPKIITTGSGGFLITDDKEDYEKIRLIKTFGRKKRGNDECESKGYNFMFTDLQAVIGIEQMKKLPWRVKRKKETYSLYMDLLSDLDIDTFATDLKKTTPWMMDILVEDRDKLARYLKKKGIGTRPFYPAIHTQKPYNSNDGKIFPNATSLSEHGLWLPSSPKLTDEEIEYICDKIKEFYEKNN